jgi:hypothetical protein
MADENVRLTSYYRCLSPSLVHVTQYTDYDTIRALVLNCGVGGTMWFKGIMLGIVAAILSVILFFRAMSAIFRPHGEQIAIDPRIILQFAEKFFGGVGVGFGLVLAMLGGLSYGFWLYGQHLAKSMMK